MSIESVMLSNHLILCCPLLHLHSIFPSIRVFSNKPVSQLFAAGSQSIGASASASVLPMNIQHWFPLGWTRLISLQPKGLSSLLWPTGEGWQPTAVFFPWESHEQYETFLYRVQEKSLFSVLILCLVPYFMSLYHLLLYNYLISRMNNHKEQLKLLFKFCYQWIISSNTYRPESLMRWDITIYLF